MIKIQKIPSSKRNQFFEKQKLRFLNLKNKLLLYPAFRPVYDYFFPSGVPDLNKIKILLIGDLTKLKKIILALGEIPDCDDVFRTAYKNFHQSSLSNKLTQWIDIKTCPYCNRNYVFHYTKKGFLYEYDHYFPICLYPYLSLSLYNLIPICSSCNTAKGSFNPNNSKFMYPYEDEFGYKVKFKVAYKKIFDLYNPNEFHITFDLTNANAVLTQKAKQAISTFHLEEYYNEHKDCAANIIKICQLSNSSYASSICEQFTNLFHNKQELIESMLNTSFYKDEWKNKVLSKFTFDIYCQFRK